MDRNSVCRISVRTLIPYLGTVTAESIAAGLLELAVVGGGLYASYYLGACVGSFAVATGEYIADKVATSGVDSYPLHVAHNTCIRNGIPFQDCLTSSENRPVALHVKASRRGPR